METLRQTLLDLLTNDPGLSAILTGGVLDASTLPEDGGGAGSAPRQTGNVRIKPYAVVRWRARNRMHEGVQKFRAGNGTVEIYNYQQRGYDIIDQAIDQEITLLDDAYLNVTDRALVHLTYIHDSPEIPTTELGLAPCRFVRFDVVDFR